MLHVLIILLVLVLRWLWYVAGGRSYHHGLSGCGGGWRGWRLWYVARRRRYDWSWRRRWRPGCDAGVCTSIVAAESVARTVGVSHSWTPAVGSLPSALGGGPRPSCRTFWVLYELEGPAVGGDEQEEGENSHGEVKDRQQCCLFPGCLCTEGSG